jgi:hypothetical protein
VISPVTYTNIKNAFRKTNGGAQNLFDRLGLSTEDHPLFITTNQVRHFLNNLANHADVSQLDIAAWSGRVDIRQNRDYDHETAESILERRRRMERQLADVRASRGESSQSVHIKPADPVSRAEITVYSGHAHATEIGYCEHDFAAAPCPIFCDCLHCIEHFCIKGRTDPVKVAHLLHFAQQSLTKAQDALAMEVYGANDWVTAQRETVERLEQLHAILTDPNIPDGAMIRQTKSGRYTLAEQAMYDHEAATGQQLISPSPDQETLRHLKTDVDHD